MTHSPKSVNARNLRCSNRSLRNEQAWLSAKGPLTCYVITRLHLAPR
jgi:hypothetical protein